MGAVALAGAGCTAFTEGSLTSTAGTTSTTTTTTTGDPSQTSATSSGKAGEGSTPHTPGGTTGGTTWGRAPEGTTEASGSAATLSQSGSTSATGGTTADMSTSGSSTRGTQPTTSGSSSSTGELPDETDDGSPDTDVCLQADPEPNRDPEDVEPTSVTCEGAVVIQSGTADDPDDSDWFAFSPTCTPDGESVFHGLHSSTAGFIACITPVCSTGAPAEVSCSSGGRSSLWDGRTACCTSTGHDEHALANSRCEDGSMDQTAYIFYAPISGENEVPNCTSYEFSYYAIAGLEHLSRG